VRVSGSAAATEVERNPAGGRFLLVASQARERVTGLRVNLAVSGTFHYRHYVRHLSDEGVLNRFYYSHKRSTSAEVLGITAEQAVNVWLKEYLTHAHLRVMNHRLGNLLFPLYQDVFDRGVVRRWSSCNLLHVMLHGAARKTIPRAKGDGAVVVGEPVNSHPHFVQELLREEHDRLGIPQDKVRGLNRGQQQTVNEAAACDFLLAPSSFVARSYCERGFDEGRVKVIPWGTDLSQFSPGQRRADGEFRVLCVAQISPRKGHVDLLDACRLLSMPALKLVFIGAMTPEMKPVLEPRSAEFEYRGTVPHSRLVDEFRQADVVVLPSIEDGFSYVPLEAMACGVPVIVSRNAGASEVVEDGVTGVTVPIRSPERIAEVLALLANDVERRRAMGAEARRQMAEGHGWEAYASSLVAFYRDVLAGLYGDPQTRLRPRVVESC
jgi:glycosyltransferase involved in cell wall biosynthesis